MNRSLRTKIHGHRVCLFQFGINQLQRWIVSKRFVFLPLRVEQWKISEKVMVLTSPDDNDNTHGLRRLVSPSKTVPMGIGSFSKTSNIYQVGQWASPTKTIQKNPAGDEPMYSRNIPTGFNIVTCSSDKDDVTFSNRWISGQNFLPMLTYDYWLLTITKSYLSKLPRDTTRWLW